MARRRLTAGTTTKKKLFASFLWMVGFEFYESNQIEKLQKTISNPLLKHFTYPYCIQLDMSLNNQGLLQVVLL